MVKSEQLCVLVTTYWHDAYIDGRICKSAI